MPSDVLLFLPLLKAYLVKRCSFFSLSAEFSPLFISVFCELSRGRCKFSSFYLSSLDKVSEPRQHARYRHVEAIYGFRLFRTRLCLLLLQLVTHSRPFSTLKAACPLSGGGSLCWRTIFQGLLETIYTTMSTSQLIWQGE